MVPILCINFHRNFIHDKIAPGNIYQIKADQNVVFRSVASKFAVL